MTGAIVAALALLLAQTAGQQGNAGRDQQGSSPAGRSVVAPPGGNGIREEKRESRERKRAQENGQARGRNRKRGFLRPAQTPAQINRDPKPMGSGGPSIADEAPVQPRSRNYGRATTRGRAGGEITGRGNPAGAAPEGSAGKSEDTQPAGHQGGAEK